jgi:predicted transcriptional regulator of viral defense system
MEEYYLQKYPFFRFKQAEFDFLAYFYYNSVQESFLKRRLAMKNKDLIMQMVRENNGTITTWQVTTCGLSRGSLKYLVNKGMLERTSRGVYILPEIWEDELFNLQTRFKKGIFSRETSLFLNGLIDRTPHKFHMTFPLNYNTTALKIENVSFERVKSDLYEVGVIDIKTPGGNNVRAYGIERTLCDILRGRSHTDIQIIAEAFKRYSKSENKNIPLLSEYAKLLKVEKKLRSYLEVLL